MIEILRQMPRYRSYTPLAACVSYHLPFSPHYCDFHYSDRNVPNCITIWLTSGHTHTMSTRQTHTFVFYTAAQFFFSHLGSICMVVQHCPCAVCVCLCVFHNMCAVFAAEPRISDDNSVRSLCLCKLFQSLGNGYVFSFLVGA